MGLEIVTAQSHSYRAKNEVLQGALVCGMGSENWWAAKIAEDRAKKS